MSIGISITGINGRMGGMLARVISARSDCHISGAIGRTGADYIGKDLGVFMGGSASGIIISDDAHESFASSDAVIDFTPPPHLRHYAELAAQAHAVYICGSTGLEAEDWQALDKAAVHTPVVYSANMSLGVNLLTEIIGQVAGKLRDFDIEIYETHHRYKKDSPSGTALALGRAASEARGTAMDLSAHAANTQRRADSIGYAVSRGGSVIGDHRVTFLGDKERLEFAHQAVSRDLFADGAVFAALWALGKKPSLYSMSDVLGL